MPRQESLSNIFGMVSCEMYSFSRTSTGAVVWFRPRTTKRVCGRSEVRMESSNKKAYPDKRHDHRCEAEDHHICRLSPPPSYGQSVVYHDCVDNPCNERPGFLGVPAPIGPPGIFGPDRSGYDAYGEQGETEGHALVINTVEGFQG